MRVVPGAAQETKLLPAVAVAGAQHGRSVALNGNWAAFGAPEHTQGGTRSGAAFVYSHDGVNTWTEVARLRPTDLDPNDNFGNAVAISGSTLLVGSHWEDSGVSDGGAAYFFGHTSPSGWLQTAKVLAPAPIEETDRFGTAVAIQGNYASVGAPNKNTGGTESGRAYVFYKDPSTGWKRTGTLHPADIVAGDKMGNSLAMNDSALVIGASQDAVGAIRPGSAYVYRRDGLGTYLQEEHLSASPPEDGAQFGYSVAISGDTAVVGSPLADVAQPDGGAVHVFVRNSSGDWPLASTILPHDARVGDRFGASLALDGDHLAIGATGDDDLGEDCGSVYLYTRVSTGKWYFVREVHASDAAAGDRFGYAIALQAQALLVGAPFTDEEAGADTGAVYAFEPVDFTPAAPRSVVVY